jgi:3-dehydroquinate dehydratase/shikimate dehydrogenase
MGEAGKWTRILGLAHGAYLTYASLEAGGETAPGQISVRDMTEVFRVKELDENTEVYGIIAGDTSYSMSPYIHNAAFKSTAMNSVFVPLQVGDLDGFITRMVRQETREVELNFFGFSVTNPHKQMIMRSLDDVDDAAAKIGAVNTVKIEDGKLHGYNTDAIGFIRPLHDRFSDLKNAHAAVIGAGGAARACIYSLKNAGADTTVFARDVNKARELADHFEISVEQLKTGDSKPVAGFSNFDIVVNATPLGTRGEKMNESPATAEQLRDVKLVYDLIYNPAETRLIHEARRAGAETLGGFDMLLAQAERQFQIWTGAEAPITEMRAAAQRKVDEG